MTDQAFSELDVSGSEAGMSDQDRFLSSADIRTWKLEGGSLPLFIEPQSSALKTDHGFARWVDDNLDVLNRLVVENGGIVLRGFPVATTEDFNALAIKLGPFHLNYAAGAATRPKIKDFVYEATRVAANLKIPLHQEMAYLRDYPGRIAFFCCRRAEKGGETVIGDMRAVTRSIPGPLREKLERLGTINIRNFTAPPSDGQQEQIGLHPDQRSWKYAFYTADKNEVEKICFDRGLIPTWHQDDSLTVKASLPVFARHYVTGETIYRSVAQYNDNDYRAVSQLSEADAKELDKMFSKQTIKSSYTLGDGTELSKEERGLITSLFTENEVRWPWQNGDVMILDNLLAAHGRNPYFGDRDVQVALLS